MSRLLSGSLLSDPDDLPAVVGANGVRFKLSDGREVIDATNSPGGLGHQHPRIVEAMEKAITRSPVIDEGWHWPDRDEAAEELLDIAFAGEDWVGAVRFGLSGSEINDLALSLTQALTDRSPLVTRERAYHGMVGLSRDMTVQPQWHGGISSPTKGVHAVPPSAEVRTVPFPFGNLCSGLELTRKQAHELLAPAASTLDDAASVIVDYSQGTGYPSPGYQDELARLARERGALWIADEVITGFGKMGLWFNFQRGDERPDIVTVGKSFGGGMTAAAAMIVSKDVLEMMGDASWRNYSALRAQPITIAAIREYVKVVRDEDLVGRVAAVQPRMAENMRKLQEAHPSLARVDGHGYHWSLELAGYDWRSWTGDSSKRPLGDEVSRAALASGVLVATSGEAGALLVSLPLIIEDEDLEHLFAALDTSLELADKQLA